MSNVNKQREHGFDFDDGRRRRRATPTPSWPCWKVPPQYHIKDKATTKPSANPERFDGAVIRYFADSLQIYPFTGRATSSRHCESREHRARRVVRAAWSSLLCGPAVLSCRYGSGRAAVTEGEGADMHAVRIMHCTTRSSRISGYKCLGRKMIECRNL